MLIPILFHVSDRQETQQPRAFYLDCIPLTRADQHASNSVKQLPVEKTTEYFLIHIYYDDSILSGKLHLRHVWPTKAKRCQFSSSSFKYTRFSKQEAHDIFYLPGSLCSYVEILTAFIIFLRNSQVLTYPRKTSLTSHKIPWTLLLLVSSRISHQLKGALCSPIK